MPLTRPGSMLPTSSRGRKVSFPVQPLQLPVEPRWRQLDQIFLTGSIAVSRRKMPNAVATRLLETSPEPVPALDHQSIRLDKHGPGRQGIREAGTLPVVLIPLEHGVLLGEVVDDPMLGFADPQERAHDGEPEDRLAAGNACPGRTGRPELVYQSPQCLQIIARSGGRAGQRGGAPAVRRGGNRQIFLDGSLIKPRKEVG